MFNIFNFYIIINLEVDNMNKKMLKGMAIFLALIMVASSVAGIVLMFVK